MSSTERGRMILLRSVLDVGWSAARRTGKKSSSEADERHGSGTRAHPLSLRSDSVTFTDNYALRRSYHVIIEYFCMPTTPENISYLYGGPEI